MGMTSAVVRSAQLAWDTSVARFGQAQALSNARHAATRMSRQRVDREDVRIFLDRLDGGETDAPGSPHPVPPPRSAGGSRS